MHVERHARRLEHLRVVAWLGLLPTLRIAEEELHDVGAISVRGGEWIVLVDVRTDQHVASLVSGSDAHVDGECRS